MSTKTISIIYLAMQTPALKSEVQMLWNYFNYKREFKELSAQRLYTMYMLLFWCIKQISMRKNLL